MPIPQWPSTPPPRLCTSPMSPATTLLHQPPTAQRPMRPMRPSALLSVVSKALALTFHLTRLLRSLAWLSWSWQRYRQKEWDKTGRRCIEVHYRDGSRRVTSLSFNSCWGQPASQNSSPGGQFHVVLILVESCKQAIDLTMQSSDLSRSMPNLTMW